MVNIVVVSHSKKLAEGVIELASQMTQGKVAFGLAAGVDDPENPIGTDPVAIMEAVESVGDSDSILIMVDMGSAILSTDVALDLVDPDLADKIHVCAASIVEGTVSAAVAAASGQPVEQVMSEAHNALGAKYTQLNQEHLLMTASNQEEAAFANTDGQDTEEVTIRIENPNGIHARPSSVIAKAMNQFDAEISLGKDGKWINAKSVNNIALLSVKFDDEVTLRASGAQAELAIKEFVDLSKEQFGDKVNEKDSTTTEENSDSGKVIRANAYLHSPSFPDLSDLDSQEAGLSKLSDAIAVSMSELDKLIDYTRDNISENESEIFSAHKMMLEDGELFDMASELVNTKQFSASKAWLEVIQDMSGEYKSIDDDYLSQRYVDVYDVGSRVLRHLNQERQAEIKPEMPSIVFADYLLPSEVVALDRELVRGIRFTDIGLTSHSALIAKAMGIPVLTGPLDFELSHGDEVSLTV